MNLVLVRLLLFKTRMYQKTMDLLVKVNRRTLLVGVRCKTTSLTLTTVSLLGQRRGLMNRVRV